MRKAFTAAFIASVLTAVVWVWAPPIIEVLLAASTAGLFGLWLAHLATYAWRRITLARKAAPADVSDFARRAFFPAFASIFVGAAIATALPTRSARADLCGASGYSCSNPTPVCCYTPSKGYYCASSLSNC